MINSTLSCFTGVLLIDFGGCFAFVSPICPIQERLQPTRKRVAMMGANRMTVSLLRFFLRVDFVISAPATYVVT